MTEKLIPLAAMENVIKSAGAARVSENAKEALKKFLESEAAEISEHAIVFCNHAERRTIKAKDVELAFRYK